jgi:hypothetical protein
LAAPSGATKRVDRAECPLDRDLYRDIGDLLERGLARDERGRNDGGGRGSSAS